MKAEDFVAKAEEEEADEDNILAGDVADSLWIKAESNITNDDLLFAKKACLPLKALELDKEQVEAAHPPDEEEQRKGRHGVAGREQADKGQGVRQREARRLQLGEGVQDGAAVLGGGEMSQP